MLLEAAPWSPSSFHWDWSGRRSYRNRIRTYHLGPGDVTFEASWSKYLPVVESHKFSGLRSIFANRKHISGRFRWWREEERVGFTSNAFGRPIPMSNGKSVLLRRSFHGSPAAVSRPALGSFIPAEVRRLHSREDETTALPEGCSRFNWVFQRHH